MGLHWITIFAISVAAAMIAALAGLGMAQGDVVLFAIPAAIATMIVWGLVIFVSLVRPTHTQPKEKHNGQ